MVWLVITGWGGYELTPTVVWVHTVRGTPRWVHLVRGTPTHYEFTPSQLARCFPGHKFAFIQTIS